MPFESILTEPFEHKHETDQFARLSTELDKVFGGSEDSHLLIGNVMCGRAEIDAILIKKDALCVIEMKSMGGEITFSQNGPWHCQGKAIKCNRHVNPFRQVRSYRFDMMSELNRWEREGALQPTHDSPWSHLSACILFDSKTTVKSKIPANVKTWLSIADLSSVGDVMQGLKSSRLSFNEYDFDLLVRRLGGLTADERVRQRELAATEKMGALIFDRTSDISQMMKMLRIRGGASVRTAQYFEELLKRSVGGFNAFNELKSEPIPEINGARRYEIAKGHSLIMISHHLFSCPVAIGLDHTIDNWIESHRGVTYLIDSRGRITKTYVNSKGDDKLQVTDADLPLLRRIPLDLESLVPLAFIRNGLLDLRENHSDDSIDQVLEAVGDESIRSLLSDLLYRLRSGDLEAAKARLDLYHGNSIEVDELESRILNPDVNSDNFVEISGLEPHELKRLLEPGNFAEWMVFLHPEQRKIAFAEFGQRALLTGVSGSGKTCVLVHRARHLARKYPGERIGILTLNRNLSHLLNNLVRTLCSGEEIRNISVYAAYDFFKSLVDHFGPEQELENLRALGKRDPEFGRSFSETISSINPKNFARPFDPLSNDSNYRKCWEKFIQRPIVRTKLTYFCDVLRTQAAKIDPYAYLIEEFSLIRSGCLTATRVEEYLELKRDGRAIRLAKKDRLNVLSLLLLFEETMLQEEAIDELALTLAVTPHMKSLATLPEELRFRCLLIDEFQDLSTRDLAVLQRIVPGAEDALFLTGDMVQQVMVKTLNLPKVGFTKGAYDSQRIRKNYRNSRQILLAANDLVLHYGQIATQQNEEMQILDPEFAIRETSWPTAVQAEGTDAASEIAIAWRLAAECIEATGALPWSVCIVTTCPDEISIDDIISAKPAGCAFAARKLAGDYGETRETMTVGTMSDVKGFEFSVIVVVGCGNRHLPSPGRAADEIWRDALRLYVAMTRARDQVFLIYSGEPSEIVTSMNTHLHWQGS